MIMTICSKLGTRGLGVAVGVEEGTGVSVAVGRTAVEVNMVEGTDMGALVGTTEEGVQAANKISRKIQKPERFMKISILFAAFGVL
jgi:hypothetical protein